MAILAQLVDGVVAQRFEIDSPLSIGRLAQNDIVIDEPSVSSQHAVIECKANPDFPTVLEFFIRDLGSTNGTEVNGEKITEEQILHHQDEVKIAWNSFKFLDDDSLNLSKTVHILE